MSARTAYPNEPARRFVRIPEVGALTCVGVAIVAVAVSIVLYADEGIWVPLGIGVGLAWGFVSGIAAGTAAILLLLLPVARRRRDWAVGGASFLGALGGVALMLLVFLQLPPDVWSLASCVAGAAVAAAATVVIIRRTARLVPDPLSSNADIASR